MYMQAEVTINAETIVCQLAISINLAQTVVRPGK